MDASSRSDRARLLIALAAASLGGAALFLFWPGKRPPAKVAPDPLPAAAPPAEPARLADEDPFAAQRRRMVAEDLRGRDITDERVLAAMATIPRHEYVASEFAELAYADRPLPIGYDQTISQPYIVALMTQLARPPRAGRVLDIGTGSGYQAAVLAGLAREVYSIEIVPELAREAQARLTRLGVNNVVVREGDGYVGWPEHAPFDAIVVAAAPGHVPPALVAQLAPGGRLVIPVGTHHQELLVLEKQPDGSVREVSVAPVRFVPMTGAAEE